MINISELRIGNFCIANIKSSDSSSAKETSELSALDKIRAQIRRNNNQTIYQIVSINKIDGIGVLDLSTQEVSEVQSEDIDPIRLSPNLLRSCGFKEKTFTSNDLFEKYLTIDGIVPIRISEYKEQTRFAVYVFDKNTSSNTFLCEISYLHQLQNLYFELTRNDLVVDLNFEKQPALN